LTVGTRHPIPGVGVVILRRAETGVEVLLIQRGQPPRQGQWSLPGGKQEWGETVQEAAKREVREETNLEVDILGLIDVVDLVDLPNTHYALIDFLATPTGGSLQAGSDAADAVWVSVSALSDYALWSETQRIIARAVDMFEP